MKLRALALACSFAALPLGCGNTPTDQLTPGGGYDSIGPTSLAGGQRNTQHHFQDSNAGDNGLTDPNQVQQEVQQAGSPEVIARLHGCTKLTYAAFGNLLTSRGIDLTSTNPGSTADLYNNGQPSLGVANYGGRVPEATFSSTASLSKQMDILVAAAREIVPATAMGPATACPGTLIVDATGSFTMDGVSCLIGKPANQDYVNLANQAVTQAPDPTTGQQIAIAALLEAAHTCE